MSKHIRGGYFIVDLTGKRSKAKIPGLYNTVTKNAADKPCYVRGVEFGTGIIIGLAPGTYMDGAIYVLNPYKISNQSGSGYGCKITVDATDEITISGIGPS